ncbi:MAG: VWA domain-containing protein [Polyangiales bacterium]
MNAVKLTQYSLAAGHPAVLAVGALVAAIVLWRLIRADVALSRPRRVLSSIFAFLALIAAVLAAGEVELIRPADRMTVVVAADRSRSIDLVPGGETKIRDGIRDAELKMLKDDRLGVIRFGASAALAEPLHGKGEGMTPTEPTIGRDATDLEAAIRRAVDEVLAGGGGRVVLLSDGVANRGDALTAAARARALGVPIDVVVLTQETLPDLRVVSARGPTLADEGETIEIRAVVHTPPRDKPVDVEVKVMRDGVLLSTFKAQVSSGEDVLRFKDKPTEPGLHRYDVHVRPLDASVDSNPEDNEATTFVRVRGPSTVLVLQKEEHKAAPLRNALEAEGYRVVVKGRFSVPVDLAEFAAYDLVVLADVPAKDLLPAQMDAMAKYVKDFGGGLLLLGSDSSMGPGGYARTPIEEISPVAFDLTKERRRSALTELIVIDYSGSMAAHVEGKLMKIDLANEAAARSAALLGAGDRLGVWHVDTAVRQTIPMGPVGDKDEIAKKIRSVGPGGGGIYIDLSLREGYKELSKETQNLRHMLLFSDGADAEERNDAPVLVKKAATMGITTSVIALGDGPDVPGLAEMAKIGNGRFYLITDARKLPAVFAQETILAARSSIHEEDFIAKVRSTSGAIKGLSFGSSPALHGLVVTQPKPRSQLVLDGPEGDPVLALWPIGLGHTAAWTSDFTDVWGSHFIKWSGAAQLMAQLAREIGRKADEARVRLDAQAKDGVLHVTAEPTGISGSAGLLHLKAHVEGPDGVAHDVDLLPGPGGTYVTDLQASAPGAYVVRAIDVGDDGKGVAPAGLAAALLSRADELRPTGSDRRALERIAELTGGVVDSAMSEVFVRRTGLRPTALPLAPFLLPLALALMLLGVASRRLGVPVQVQRALAWVAGLPKRATTRGEGRAPKEEPVIVTTTAKVTQVAAPTRAVETSPLIIKNAPRQEAPAAASGVAAALAQKRKDTAAKKESAPSAPVIVRAEKPKPASSTGEGASSLADLARKKREKKEG